MIRIQLSELVIEDGKYHFDDQLFTGAGYARGEAREVRTFQIEDGSVVGPYIPNCAEGGRGHPQIEVTGLLAVEENTKYPLDFDGGHFTGIGYEFHNGYCNHEMLFVDGAVRCESWWRSTGMLLAYNRSGEFFENYRWRANGKMDSATVAAAPLRIMFNFFDSGELQSLIIDGDVRSRLPDLAQLEHFPVKTWDCFGGLRGGAKVFFAREGIDDQLLELMAHTGVFEKTQSLTLKGTSVTGQSLSSLAQLGSLQKLVIESDNEQQQELASELSKRRPDLVVDHKSERVF